MFDGFGGLSEANCTWAWPKLEMLWAEVQKYQYVCWSIWQFECKSLVSEQDPREYTRNTKTREGGG